MRPTLPWKLSMALVIMMPFTAQAVSIKDRLRAFVGRPAKASDTAEQLTPDENRIRDMQKPEMGAIWVAYIQNRKKEVANTEIQRETAAKEILTQVLQNVDQNAAAPSASGTL